jgi:hypothetical protein
LDTGQRLFDCTCPIKDGCDDRYLEGLSVGIHFENLIAHRANSKALPKIAPVQFSERNGLSGNMLVNRRPELSGDIDHHVAARIKESSASSMVASFPGNAVRARAAGVRIELIRVLLAWLLIFLK